jgi:predicted O-methyltransferase YrrM
LGLANTYLKYGNFWDEDLSRYDMVYCFLSPEPMPALYRKACAEMRPGSLIISNSFDVPGVPADEILDRRHTRLFFWRLS